MPPGIGYPGMTPGFNPGAPRFGPYGLSRMMAALRPNVGLFANAEQAPGLFAARKQPQGVAERIKAAFGGDEGLLQAGLAMMAASGPAPVRPNLGRILAQGAQVGQQAGEQARDKAQLEQMEEEVRGILGAGLGTGTPAEIDGVLQQLLPYAAAGHPGAAQAVQQLSQLRGQTISQLSGQAAVDERRAAREQEERHFFESMREQRAIRLQQSRLAAQAAEAEARAKAEERVYDRTRDLSGDYRKDTSVHADIAASFGSVLASAEDPSPAGDISLVFAFMKMIDPNSAVREGEQATARNAGNVPDWVRSQYNRLLGGGEQFTSDRREDFVDRAKKLAAERREQLRLDMERYRKKAQDVGAVPDHVVFDYYKLYDEALDSGSQAGSEPGQFDGSDPFGDLIPGGSR